MVSSGMLRRVALVRTDVSEEAGVSFIRVTRIGELGTTQAATSNRRRLRRNSHRSENLKSYKSYIVSTVIVFWVLIAILPTIYTLHSLSSNQHYRTQNSWICSRTILQTILHKRSIIQW
jgi:hypothetical protein